MVLLNEKCMDGQNKSLRIVKCEGLLQLLVSFWSMNFGGWWVLVKWDGC